MINRKPEVDRWGHPEEPENKCSITRETAETIEIGRSLTALIRYYGKKENLLRTCQIYKRIVKYY